MAYSGGEPARCLPLSVRWFWVELSPEFLDTQAFLDGSSEPLWLPACCTFIIWPVLSWASLSGDLATLWMC